MIKRVIVGLDGSALAERALGLAVPIARGAGARLVLVRAAERPDAGIAATSYLDVLAQHCAADGLTTATVVALGEPAAIIAGQARPGDDIVVLTTHGQSGLGRWTFGGVAEQVLLRTRAPVLLARAWTPPWALTSASRPLSLMVPLDGSSAAEAALPPAIDLARALDAQIVLAGVVDIEPAGATSRVSWGVAPAEPPRESIEIVVGYLDGLARQLIATGLRAVSAVRVGMPAAEIADIAHDARAALIVMATVGHANITDTVVGPVALETLHLGGRPVLFVRSNPVGS